MKTWNERLAHALSESKYKPNQLATILKVSAPTVSAWIAAGNIKRAENITGENLLKVCRLLDIHPEWLILGELPMRPKGKLEHSDVVRPISSWPFKFSREAFDALPSRQRDLIEAYAQAYIDDAVSTERKGQAG